MSTVLGPWEPLSPDEVALLLRDADVPWWIAGGWAVDLHLGRRTRLHEDTDVLVLREHVPDLRRALTGWDLHAADPPGTLRPWPEDEPLPAHVVDVWCRRTPSRPWSLQLVIDGTDGEDWVFRRDPRVRRPWPSLDGPASVPGRRVLAPEVQLLYKSARPRPKDEADFEHLLGALDDAQRGWLTEALTVSAPHHHWLVRLRD